MTDGRVVSLADRLKQRREELGLSQAQAARELDVARTAYRLWEMEAAKPQPDRWRLISRWLGVSVTTMLLADELQAEGMTNDDAVTTAFDRVGRRWHEPMTAPSEFFRRIQELARDGAEKGFISTAHAEELMVLVARVEEEQLGGAVTAQWEPARLDKEIAPTIRAPKAARDAVAFIGADLPTETVRDAELLTSELVSNGVKYGELGRGAKIGMSIDVNRERLRVEVTDTGAESPRQRASDEAGRHGLLLVEGLASRWRMSRIAGGNLTWFEIDLAQPGARPERR
jgi:transcriptional regulator with XRE-family HTH domain/anti-sigma regulatory factor (Ser/Thr protein kinase)